MHLNMVFLKNRSLRACARLVASALWLSACAEPAVLSPAAPSALPANKVERLSIACSADVLAQSFDGQPAIVRFELPSTTGGQEPLTVGCTPESGNAFNIGTTEVSCSASDALRQSANCAFRVTVLGPPMLEVMRFVAFGDSLTTGVVSSPVAGTRPEPTSAYPYLLQRDLQSRYGTQAILIVNAGTPGEKAADAVSRFDSTLTTHRPEVVLLMEGTNDLAIGTGGGAAVAAQAVDSMVRRARATGADVLLMTIPPQRNTAPAALVPSLNDLIRSIAAQRGAVLVDVYNLLLRGSCPGGSTIPCIGADGLHPTADGYRLIADELVRVIVDRYDIEISGDRALIHLGDRGRHSRFARRAQ